MLARLLVGVMMVLGLSATALADCGCNAGAAPAVAYDYAPAAVPAVSYYEPATAYYAAPVASVPLASLPYAAPTTYVASYAAPAPYVASYAPVTAYYAPTTAYYAPVAPVYAPAPVVVRYGYPGVSVFGAPRVYVPGEPIRNTFRVITP